MIRKIIQIDEEKCNGCGACADACHEGAIAIVDGKAKLMRDDYCDGFGDCLPACPMDAITFVEREAAAYDEAAVIANKERKEKEAAAAAAAATAGGHGGAGCPGSRMRMMKQEQAAAETSADDAAATSEPEPSQLAQWPCQIKLVPVGAPFFQGADLLVAADCTAFAYASFHRDFMAGKTTIIGCPKLDNVNYAEKLSQIFSQNDIRSISVLRMEVPCCGGLDHAVRTALADSGKDIPCDTTIISISGSVRP